MEKWKVVLIAALLLSLGGMGFWNQKRASQQSLVEPTPAATAIPSPFQGKALPPWNFKNWSGQPASQQELKGKPSLIEFFRIDCPHCADAAPFMEGLHKRYGPRGLKIVGVQAPFKKDSIANDWKLVQDFIKENRIEYPVAFDKDSNYFLGTIKKDIFKGEDWRMSWPTMLILDAQGQVEWVHTGYDISNTKKVSQTIDLATRLEKLYPSGGSVEEDAQGLVDWLKNYLPPLQIEGKIKQEVVEHVAQELRE